MAEFKDAKGDDWDVVINGATIKRILDHLKVDLGRPLEAAGGSMPLLTRLDTEIALLVDVIYVVCLPQADQREIEDVEFAERLDGEALYAAHEALLEALTDFFQSRRRPETVRAIGIQRKTVARAVKLAEETFASEEFAKAIDRKLKTLGKSFVNSLRSPESSPSREPSGN